MQLGSHLICSNLNLKGEQFDLTLHFKRFQLEIGILREIERKLNLRCFWGG